MMRALVKDAVKAAFRAFGVRIVAASQVNRFQGMEEVLQHLVTRGFAPKLVVDAGANKGQWANLASAVFTLARFHLIEPQPACYTALERTYQGDSRFTIHSLAVSAPSVSHVTMFSVDDEGNTGAYVGTVKEESVGAVLMRSTTLDELVGTTTTTADRPLLKLDLEGHELQALQGAEKLLQVVEVILLEAHLYDPEHLGRSTANQIFAYLNDRGFALYDVASLSSRKRDGRLRQADLVFVRLDSPLLADDSWS